jgi:radical SAM superfamily enzyme YgiQ (UPF0313 family)
VKVKCHLVSMPWAHPKEPSVAVATLKAYLNQVLDGQASVNSYFGHLSIPIILGEGGFVEIHETATQYGEMTYFYLCLRKFLSKDDEGLSQKVLELIQQKDDVEADSEDIDKEDLDDIEEATQQYIDEKIAPQLDKDSVNIIGFSLSYSQIYGSIYSARYIKEKYPDRKIVFVFGGVFSSLPRMSYVLNNFGVSGLTVIGEGEKKLELIVKQLLAQPDSTDLEQFVQNSHWDDKCIAPISGEIKQFSAEREAFKNQLSNLDELPIPDYSDYLKEISAACESEEALKKLIGFNIRFGQEGTRGCFGRCDFCSLNHIWKGYRRRKAEQVIEMDNRFRQKYPIALTTWVDNACDSWIDKYSDYLVAHGIKRPYFLELRADHDQMFWTKLSLSGVAQVQIGVEALSPPLLKKMKKGVRVVDTLMSLKYIKELHIDGMSNLIFNHPKTTIEDIHFTLESLSHLTHFPRLAFSSFALQYGSPLFFELIEDPLASNWVRDEPYNDPRFHDLWCSLYYLVPKEKDVPMDVKVGWQNIISSYDQAMDEAEGDELSIYRQGDHELVVVDSRVGTYSEHKIQGDIKQVFDLCHQARTLNELKSLTGWEEDKVRKQLSSLIEKRILLQIEEYYLNLAIRDRDELISEFYSSNCKQ